MWNSQKVDWDVFQMSIHLASSPFVDPASCPLTEQMGYHSKDTVTCVNAVLNCGHIGKMWSLVLGVLVTVQHGGHTNQSDFTVNRTVRETIAMQLGGGNSWPVLSQRSGKNSREADI